MATVSLSRQTSQLGGNQIPSSVVHVVHVVPSCSFGEFITPLLSSYIKFLFFLYRHRPPTTGSCCCSLDDVIPPFRREKICSWWLNTKEMRVRITSCWHINMNSILTHRSNKQSSSYISSITTPNFPNSPDILWRLFIRTVRANTKESLHLTKAEH